MNDFNTGCYSSVRDPVLIIGFIICAVAIITPIYSTDVYPFVDYPVHLSLIQLAGGHAPQPVNADQFETHWFTPYAGTFVIGKLLNYFLPVEQTGRVLLSLYLLMTPLAFIFLLRSAGSDTRYGLLMFLLLYNFNLSWGFLPFLMSIPVLLIVLALALKTAADFPRRCPILLAATMIVLFFTHLFSFMIAAILTGLILLTGPSSRSGKLKNLLAVFAIPAVLSLIWYLSLTYSSSDAYFISRAFRTFSLRVKLKYFADFVISGMAGRVYGYIFFAFIAIGVLYLVTGFRHRSRSGGETGAVTGRIIIGAGFAVIYLICPYSLLTAVWLPNRLAFLAVAGAILWLPVYRTKGRLILDAGIVILTLILAFSTIDFYGKFYQEYEPVQRCLSHIEPGKSLRMLLMGKRSSVTDNEPFGHLDQYYQIRGQGAVHNTFATLLHMPVRYIPEEMEKEAGFRTGVRITDKGIVANIRFDSYHYFLVRFASDARHVEVRKQVIAALFKENASRIRMVAQDDMWELFEKTDVSMKSGNELNETN